jgi:hypothetical protein
LCGIIGVGFHSGYLQRPSRVAYQASARGGRSRCGHYGGGRFGGSISAGLLGGQGAGLAEALDQELLGLVSRVAKLTARQLAQGLGGVAGERDVDVARHGGVGLPLGLKGFWPAAGAGVSVNRRN